jgi:hypothetical protein
MILMVSLIQFRDNDYLLWKQVFSQTELRTNCVQPALHETFTRIPLNSANLALGPIRSRSALFKTTGPLSGESEELRLARWIARELAAHLFRASGSGAQRRQMPAYHE